MRSYFEVESQLNECRRRLADSFFGTSDEHLRYWRRRVDFLEWVLGNDTPLMSIQEANAGQIRTSLVNAKMMNAQISRR